MVHYIHRQVKDCACECERGLLIFLSRSFRKEDMLDTGFSNFIGTLFGKAVIIIALLGVIVLGLGFCAVVGASSSSAYDNPVIAPIYNVMPDGDYGFYHSHYHSYYQTHYHSNSCLVNCGNTHITVKKSHTTVIKNKMKIIRIRSSSSRRSH